MDITLDSDLSQQLSDCKEGEKITITGTVTSNDGTTVEANLDTAESSDTEEEGETPNASEGEGQPEASAQAPNLPGPVQMLMKGRK